MESQIEDFLDPGACIKHEGKKGCNLAALRRMSDRYSSTALHLAALKIFDGNLFGSALDGILSMR